MKGHAFWAFTACWLVNRYKPFKGVQCLYPLGLLYLEDDGITLLRNRYKPFKGVQCLYPLGLLYLEDDGITLLRNVSNCSPVEDLNFICNS